MNSATPARTDPPRIPRVGMVATARNRRAVIAGIDQTAGRDKRLHLVHLDYLDHHSPPSERLVWEIEPGTRLHEPNDVPNGGAPPMPPADFDALLRAARWTALTPYLHEGGGEDPPPGSPFHGGVRIEPYQLVPLVKALRMPRVNLLIADDVGLGKTVEAGLILTELLLRRRIRRVLVLTPASLRRQWKEEMRDKFALRFEIVDRRETEHLRRSLGMDANPWRSHDRIVASYHYLRQPEIREQFRSAHRPPKDSPPSPRLPWDLLIVDECHNLMPAPVGEDSELCRTLREITPHFEHRLFLSATPHNGHTGSFTGLLAMLDPVRFHRTTRMTPALRRRTREVVVRRLKRHLDPSANGGAEGDTGAPRRFCRRLPPEALLLRDDPLETELSAAFSDFRERLHRLVRATADGRRRAGNFAVEVLNKRLLSCPTAFAESWRRVLSGLADQPAEDAQLMAEKRALDRDTGDDRETERREAVAAEVTGSWLRNYEDGLRPQIERIGAALAALGFDLADEPVEHDPAADTRLDALTRLIEDHLRDGGAFRGDERLIVFTEYKTTLDYLTRRLRERYPEERVLTLFGAGGAEGMGEDDREAVKSAFNDPGAAVRILVATDAASEGLNLQRTARRLLHYDCPWNPSRLEQRNGRLDRYGQGRDVSIHHFLSEGDPDLKFLARLVEKANEMRDDLGSVNEVFDRAVHRRLVLGEQPQLVEPEFERSLETARDGARYDADESTVSGIGDFAARLDLHPDALRHTLAAALRTAGGDRPLAPAADRPGAFTVANPDLPGWREVFDGEVRLSANGAGLGPMPRLAFDEEPFLEACGSLTVFRPRPEMQLVHLAHPLIRRSLAVLARRRYPGTGATVSRWTARRGGFTPETLPEAARGAEAVVLFSVEEFAVNELREPFHRWVRTLAFPVRGGELGEPLPEETTRRIAAAESVHDPEDEDASRELLDDVGSALKKRLSTHRFRLGRDLRSALERRGETAKRRETEDYDRRQAEVSELITGNKLEKIERDLAALREESERRMLFDTGERAARISRSRDLLEEEHRRTLEGHEALRRNLAEERDRILNRLVPARYALAGEVQVFPVTVEIRLPEKRG